MCVSLFIDENDKGWRNKCLPVKMTTTKLGYKSEHFVIDDTTINQFELLTSRRKLRENKVSQIKKILLAGKHFDAPLVISQNGNKKVVDGQHRITAIKQAIERNPNFSVEVLLLIYKNLTKEQQVEVFRKWNIGTKQGTDDFIKMHEEDIKILKKMQRTFPCQVTIYKESGKLHFKLLAGSYIAAKQKHEGGYTASNETFVDQVICLKNKDYQNMAQFVDEFLLNTSGALDKSNLYLNTTPFAALFYLYHHNVLSGKIESKDFWIRFRTRVAGDKDITQMSLAGGITATKMVQNLMFANMNRVKDGSAMLQLPYTRPSHDSESEDEEVESESEED